MKIIIIKLILVITLLINIVYTLNLNLKTKTSTSTSTSTHTNTNMNSLMKFKSQLKIGMNSSFYHKLKNNNNKTNNNNISTKSHGDNNNDIIIKSHNKIIYQTWVKFFKYKKTTKNNSPKGFFINYEYQKEAFNNPNVSLKEKTDPKSTYIPTENSFDAILKDKFLLFLNSRQEDKQNTSQVDVLNIADIDPVPEDDSNYKEGGIEDFGNYKEGYCFRVKTRGLNSYNTNNNGNNANNANNSNNNKEALLQEDIRGFIWIICTSDVKLKLNLMKYIKDQTTKLQRNNGIVFYIHNNPQANNSLEGLSSNQNEKNKNQDLSTLTNTHSNDVGKIIISKNGSVDGYWYELQDWTKCDLPCGGGYSYRQRTCVPPKNGGADCQGDKILKRPCNTHSCPKKIKHNLQNKNKKIKTITKTLPPIRKVIPFTNRPQRYEKCIVKESDLMYKDIDNNEDFPVRIIMNNRTISLYKSESFNSHFITFELLNTTFHQDKINSTCFDLIESNHKTAQLCPFGNDKMIHEWLYDFKLFKHQCQKQRDITQINEFKLDNEFKDEVEKYKKQIHINSISKAQNNLLNHNNNKIETDVDRKALEERARLIEQQEKIIEEQREKHQNELQAIEEKAKKEKLKFDLINNAIKTKQEEDQLNVEEQLKKSDDEATKKQAQKDMLNDSIEFKKTLKQMEKSFKSDLERKTQKLMEQRMEMSKESAERYKKGDQNSCKLGMKTVEDRDAYCVSHFNADQYEELLSCKGEDFCEVCCMSEFGDNVKEREDCIKNVCVNDKKDNQADSDGQWVWMNDDNKNNGSSF